MITKSYQITERQRFHLNSILSLIVYAGDLKSYLDTVRQTQPDCDDFHDLARLFHDPIVPEEAAPLECGLFTEEDKSVIFGLCCDEAADMSTRERGEQLMGELDLISCIGYTADNFEDGSSIMAELLSHLDAGPEAYCTGEFIRVHADDPDTISLLDLAKRMGLMNEAEDQLTERGRDYVSQYS